MDFENYGAPSEAFHHRQCDFLEFSPWGDVFLILFSIFHFQKQHILL